MMLLFAFDTKRLYGQPDNGHIVISKTRTGIDYKDFVIDNTQLYTLNDSGVLVVWSLKTYDTLATICADGGKRFYSIGKDHRGNIYLGAADTGLLYIVDKERLICRVFLHSKYWPIVHILFNAADHPYFIIPYALYDPMRGKYWTRFPNSEGSQTLAIKRAYGFPNIFGRRKNFKRRIGFGRYEYRSKCFLSLPDVAVMSTKDMLAMVSDGGEWSGRFYFFDARKRRVKALRKEDTYMRTFDPIAAFADDVGNRNYSPLHKLCG